MTSHKVVALHEAGQPAPISIKRTVPFRTKSTKPRDYLTKDEVALLIAQAKQGRYGHRDSTMITMAFRHGLRVSELACYGQTSTLQRQEFI
jgi:site-specific recombinase XerD